MALTDAVKQQSVSSVKPDPVFDINIARYWLCEIRLVVSQDVLSRAF
jgi:hypothetical protein